MQHWETRETPTAHARSLFPSSLILLSFRLASSPSRERSWLTLTLTLTLASLFSFPPVYALLAFTHVKALTPGLGFGVWIDIRFGLVEQRTQLFRVRRLLSRPA